MPNAARLTDAVDGTTAGEHSGHVPPHSPEPVSYTHLTLPTIA